MIVRTQTCRHEQGTGLPRPAGRRLAAGVVGGLAVLGGLLTLGRVLAPWVWMWVLVAGLLGWIKLLMLLRLAPDARARLTTFRLLGYLLLWPGTRPEPFLTSGRQPAEQRPSLGLFGLLYVTAGVLVLWLALPVLGPRLPGWALAWLGMAGLSLLVHFGLFDLLAAVWRAAGVPVEQVFHNPVGATSLADFWGNRWNRAFSGFARELILRPLARRLSSRGAGLAVFLVSGVLHELVITVPAGAGFGGPTLYFVIQGLLTQAESLGPVRSLRRRGLALGWLWTFVAVLGPAPLLFPAPFLERVVLPFLCTLAAAG